MKFYLVVMKIGKVAKFASNVRVITLSCCSCVFQEVYGRITGFSNKVAQFLKTVDERLNRKEKYLTWDQLAAASVINAAVVLETENVCASVELHCAESRGLMMVDFNNTQGKMANVCVVTKVDQALYENLMTSAFSIW